MFICESVRGFLFEGYELSDVCFGFNVEGACSANYNRNELNFSCECTVCLQGLFERIIDLIYVVYHCLCVPIR